MSGLVVQNKDGVMYVTTATDSADATLSGTLSGREAITAQTITPPKGFAVDISAFINSILTLVFVISALLVFGSLIWGGFQWLTSGGDKGKTEAAKNRIIAAVVGIVILAASYALLTIVLRFLGFSDLNDVLTNVGTINGPATATRSGILQPIQPIQIMK